MYRSVIFNMNNTKIRKKRNKNTKGSLIFVCVILIIFLYTVINLYYINNSINSTKSESFTIQSSLMELKNENKNLKSKIDNTYTDESVENIARNELRMSKQGEILFNID